MHIPISWILSLIIIIFLSSCNSPTTLLAEWIHLSSAKGDIPIPGSSTQQTACLILDVDKNGINDFVIGCRERGPSVLWYRRNASGWIKYLIDNDFLPIEAGGAFSDIDGDGDLDIVFGGDRQSNKLWWWENPYPNFMRKTPWKRRIIKKSGLNKHHDQIFGDFDGDGDEELVFWNQEAKRLFIANIPLNPQKTQPWAYYEIFSSLAIAEGLAKDDIDGDGKLDIIGGGRWFKHLGGMSFKGMVIDDKQRVARVAVGQLKEGGRPEVVFVIGDGVGRLRWYEWIAGKWRGHNLLGFDVDHGHSLSIADFNDDGKLDIFCGEMRLHGRNKDSRIWVFFGDGNGNFIKKEIAAGYAVHEAKVGDLDGDGDIDILGKPYNWKTPRLDIWMNNMSKRNALSLDIWQRHVIDSKKPWRSIFITSADMDNDSKKDIITGGWWYKNPGIPGGLWKRIPFGSPLFNMTAIYDFDADNYIDVLGTKGKGSKANARFVWARNEGEEAFTIYRNISNGDGDFLQGVALASFLNTNNLEVALSWHINGKGIQILTVPSNPSRDIWPLRKISSISQDECLSAGDIDLDGNVDLLLGTKWLRNGGLSWSVFDISESNDAPDRNRLVDINGDGKLDAVIGFESISKEGKLAWYEQGDLATSPWVEHLIAILIGPMSLDVADMDRDGDIDIVVGEHNLKNQSEAKLFIFENIDGKGDTWKPHLVHIGDEHHNGARVFDIDGDGDLDIISIGWGHNRVILYENQAIIQ